jgi:heme oxygenase
MGICSLEVETREGKGLKIVDDLLKDPVHKKWSLAKLILFLGFFFASAILMKMAVRHEPEVASCYIAYLGFISGHNLFSKYLDKKKDDDHGPSGPKE